MQQFEARLPKYICYESPLTTLHPLVNHFPFNTNDWMDDWNKIMKLFSTMVFGNNTKTNIPIGVCLFWVITNAFETSKFTPTKRQPVCSPACPPVCWLRTISKVVKTFLWHATDTRLQNVEYWKLPLEIGQNAGEDDWKNQTESLTWTFENLHPLSPSALQSNLIWS